MAGLARARRIVPRSVVPNLRAVVGGLLVAAAGVGMWSAQAASDGPAPRSWLVVDRPVAPGRALTSDDLALAPMELHPDTESRAVDASDAEAVIGRVALAPLAPGDLLLRSNVAPAGAGGAGPLRRVGIALEPADALNGELAVGDVVDVVAVDEDRGARVVVEGAVVASLAGADAAEVGRSDTVRLTLLVDGRDRALELLDARRAGSITLVAGGAGAAS